MFFRIRANRRQSRLPLRWRRFSGKDSLQEGITQFRDAFDYRNAGKPMPAEARTSIESTIEFLTSRPAATRKEPESSGKSEG